MAVAVMSVLEQELGRQPAGSRRQPATAATEGVGAMLDAVGIKTVADGPVTA
jgi:hypothetical protein